MTSKDLIIENIDGKIMRTVRWNGENLFILKRNDNQRLEFHPDLNQLNSKKIPYQLIGELSDLDIVEKPFALPRECRLKIVDVEAASTVIDEDAEEEKSKPFFLLWSLLLLLGVSGIFLMKYIPAPTEAIKEDLRQQLVKIIKKPDVPEKKMAMNEANETPKPVAPKKISLKRMGALAALGSLTKSKQMGGLNLGQIHTTAGIGLGGTQGSGGVQTSIYGKGIIAAPLGTGANIKGAGGYGTKGKGGGQAGYGQISMIGSAGTSAFPLEHEAIVDGGLDREAIAEVVRRNQGQIMFCYEQGLQSSPGLNGRVAVRWTIGAQGQVKVAGIENTTLMAKTVEDCILMRLKTWKFPLPQGGVDVSVTYPFVFKRAGQG